MTMKKMLLLLLLPLLLVVSCSLTDADTPASGTAHLRLLTGSGESKTLSHPDYDDWSPQMVNFQGINLLYFLSTRPYDGPYFNGSTWGGRTNILSNTVKVLRAQEVRTGEYTNLQMYCELPAGNYAAIAVVTNEFSSAPLVYCQREFDGQTNIGYIDDAEGFSFVSIFDSTMTHLGGAWATEMGHHIILGKKNSIPRFFSLDLGLGQLVDITVPIFGLVFQAEDNIGGYEGNAVLSIKPDLSSVQTNYRDLFLQYFSDELDRLRLDQGLVYRGSGPALFTTDGTDTRFGFYVSLGGRLMQLIYLDSNSYAGWVENEYSHSLQTIVQNPAYIGFQRIIPLFSLTHYAGTIDKDPAYDQRSGNLFFASDRAGRGKFNLYYVPQEYLRVPAEVFNTVLPEM